MDPRGPVPTLHCPRCGAAARPRGGRGPLGMVLCERCDLAFGPSQGVRAGPDGRRGRPRVGGRGGESLVDGEGGVVMTFPASPARLGAWLFVVLAVVSAWAVALQPPVLIVFLVIAVVCGCFALALLGWVTMRVTADGLTVKHWPFPLRLGRRYTKGELRAIETRPHVLWGKTCQVIVAVLARPPGKRVGLMDVGDRETARLIATMIRSKLALGPGAGPTRLEGDGLG